jgi:phosphoribosylaminoimidazolecarboxamide formyltransferase/IMP cyclohydrolase
LSGKQKMKMCIVQASARPDFPYDVRVLQGAVLVQDAVDYRVKLDRSVVTVPTKRKPSPEEFEKLYAAWEVVRRVQSNGIVIANGSLDGEALTRFWTLGVASFRKRNGAVKIALDNAGPRAKGAVCASDGFFPFRDSVELLAGAGVAAVIQAGGAAKDADSVTAADEDGTAMVYTHVRAFRH